MGRPLKEDLTGKRFGKLRVIERAGSRYRQPLWRCQCDCGSMCAIPGAHLRDGSAKSCGCWRRDFSVVTKTTHGMGGKGRRRSRIYNVWNGMRQRCHNPHQISYARYGGKGVQVCEAWRKSFEAFYRDVGDPPSDGQRWTLDRIDPHGNYEPGNVRWATYEQQQANKRPKIDIKAVKDFLEKMDKKDLWEALMKAYGL